MNRLRSPIVVCPPPPAVPRWMVTNSRKTLRWPMTSRVCSPRYFRSCGGRPIEANGKISVPSPIVGVAVDDRRGADLAVAADAPLAGRSRRTGRRRCRRRSGRSGCTCADGSISAPPARRPAAARPRRRPGLRPTARPWTRTSGPLRAPSVTSRRRRSPGTTWRRNLAPVHAAQRDVPVGMPGALLDEQQRRHLRQRLDHQHSRQQRRAREVALEELFVDGDVLDGDEALARLVLGDPIDEQRRIAIAEAVENAGDAGVHCTGGLLPAGFAGVRAS